MMESYSMLQPPKGAMTLSNLIIGSINMVGRLVDRVGLNFRTIDSPEDCRTVDELRAYAYSIRHSQPGLAADLLAAADRHD
jgi:hypothetical protein